MSMFPVSEAYASVRVALFVYRTLHRIPLLRASLNRIKERTLLGPTYHFHKNFAHQFRLFALSEVDPDKPFFGNELCNACRKVMAATLACDYNRVHCTLKLIMKPEEYLEAQGLPADTDALDPVSDARVITVGRSESAFDRPMDFGATNAHRVGDNTSFASILGAYDGHRNWENPYSFFCCNNLEKHASQYACSRKGWQRLYKSTLVLAIRMQHPEHGYYKHFGFLTFDSLQLNCFSPVPDIFENTYTEHFDKFHLDAAGVSAWHIGGAMADCLSVPVSSVVSV